MVATHGLDALTGLMWVFPSHFRPQKMSHQGEMLSCRSFLWPVNQKGSHWGFPPFYGLSEFLLDMVFLINSMPFPTTMISVLGYFMSFLMGVLN